MNRELLLKEILTDTRYTGISWKAQESSSQDVLFYRFSDNENASVDLFFERLKNSNYGRVIVNAKYEQFQNLANLHSLSTEDFYWLRHELAEHYYPINRNSMRLVGITGTNGKTTTVDFIRQLLVNKGLNILTFGTLGCYKNSQQVKDFSLTSPDYIDLRKTLHEFGDGVDVAAFEVSSHSLVQRRFFGMNFDTIGWTSFSQDHLDFHGDMESYFKAKLLLRSYCQEDFRVSVRSQSLIKKLSSHCRPYDSKYCSGSDFLTSSFNLINLDVALGCMADLGYTFNEAEISKLTAPPGRFNVLEDGGRTFVIDFAHTPDALENTLKNAKALYPDKKIICVFGCGGNRDRTKRPLMGKIAVENCDFVYVTSDNPRFEEPERIISDIVSELNASHFCAIVDRKEAIARAAQEYRDAVIVIAGKGHEAYMDIKGEKKPYSDMQIVKELKSETRAVQKNNGNS